jgi:hypothetical protein
VAHLASEAIEPGDDHHVDSALHAPRLELVEAGTAELGTAHAKVVEVLIEELPPLVLHRADVVLAAFSLDVARSEVLLGVGDGLSGVDGTTENGLVSRGEHARPR